MADPQAFHEKVKRLRPPETLKPNAALVGILQHDFLPTDNLKQADVLWVKCPKSKPVKVLLNAYRNGPVEELCFRWRFEVVKKDTLLGELVTTDPDFVALEACKASDVGRRNMLRAMSWTPVENPTNVRQNTPGASYVNDRDLDDGESMPTPQPEHLPSTSESTAESMPTARPTRLPSNTPDLGPSASVPQDASLGWVDFVYERRENQIRNDRHAALRDPSRIHNLDREIQTEWRSLNPGQKSYFIQRATKLSFHGQIQQRAFWSFYYNHYYEHKAKGRNMHADFDATQSFTDKMLTGWAATPASARSVWVEIVREELRLYPVPGLRPSQANSTSATQQIGTSQRPSPIREREDLPPAQMIKQEVSQTPVPAPQTAFHTASSQSQQENEAVRLNITDLFVDKTPEQLEKSVEKGVELLHAIRQTLSSQPSQDTQQWLQTIENVEKQAVKTKTVVGVVGATGAGKSSVINAMLDEERLVPTNCMRACTAVVTEISYNHEEILYRADIEFISRQDWAKELRILFQDLIDGSGQVSRECTNEDSDAGIAYAKIKAVYPSLTREDMANATIDSLMALGNVNCLGTERKIEYDDPLLFYKKLQQYVDSKEKSTGKDKIDKEKKAPREMEFWPLIRAVRLYVKAPALATGAVIVDLPGVHDSNQARAAVAQNYMKACTGLWIVAPITRAVDDKSAKTLLGDSFKRQLKMDGGYSTVSFICSKTDDISLTEAQDSLGLEDEVRPLYEKTHRIRKSKKGLQAKLSDLKETKGDVMAAMETADEEIEVWEKLQEDLSDGKAVYKPQSETKKRKRKEKSTSRKKSKYTEIDFDDEFVDGGSDAASDAGSDYDEPVSPEDLGDPLSEAEITLKIAEFRATKKEGRRRRMDIDEEIKSLRKKFQELDTELAAIEAQLSAKCITGRNEYSRGAIQRDFAAGIKELDQELAEEEDAANFNPEVDARDYDEVARCLPVFCVSSRAYQKLMGRLEKDKDVPGFENIGETEIPKLQAHCRKLTEAGREAACKRFLNNLTQLLNSLRLWSSNDRSGRNLTNAQAKREMKLLDEKLDRLDSTLEKSVQSILEALEDEIQDSIYDVFPVGVASAQSKANQIARGWGAPVNRLNRAEGGLYWATYKAVVRRDGCFTNANGCHNFNEQLTEPLIKVVAAPWERVFSRRLSPVLSGLSSNVGTLLTEFHDEVESRATKNGASQAAFQMLKQQLPVYKETLKDASSTVKNELTTKQRDINREFVPSITDNMLSVYNDCVIESGPGQYSRMKGYMDRHVDTVKQSMYNQSSDRVRDLIRGMLKGAKKSLQTKTDEIFMAVKRDYTGVIVGQEDAHAHLLPRDQRFLRKTVLEITDDAEMVFKRALGLEPELEPEPEEGTVQEPEGDGMNDVFGSSEEQDYLQEQESVPPPSVETNESKAPSAAPPSDGDTAPKPSSDIGLDEESSATSSGADDQILAAQLYPDPVEGNIEMTGARNTRAADAEARAVMSSPIQRFQASAEDVPAGNDRGMTAYASQTSDADSPASQGNTDSNAASHLTQTDHSDILEANVDDGIASEPPDILFPNTNFSDTGKETSQSEFQYLDSYLSLDVETDTDMNLESDKENETGLWKGGMNEKEAGVGSPESFVTIENGSE